MTTVTTVTTVTTGRWPALDQLRDLRACTVRQPWATLVAQGRKPWENRSRPIPGLSAPRWVAVHAAQALHSREGLAWAAQLAPDVVPGTLPRSALLALALVGPAVRVEQVQHGDEWACGPWCHPVLQVVQLPRPVPCAGALGLWRVRGDALHDVLAAVALGHALAATKKST